MWVPRDKFVKVKGVSQLGKNRVKEHGEVWKVNISPENNYDFARFGRKYFLVSVQTNYGRWCHVVADRDFEVLGEVSKDGE